MARIVVRRNAKLQRRNKPEEAFMMTRRTASAGLVTSAILTAAAFAQTVGYPARLESHFRWSETQRPYWLAGAPLQIAPCSARFPC